jgi:hypothetical protein
MLCTADVAAKRFRALEEHFDRCKAKSDDSKDCDVTAISQEDAIATGKAVGSCFKPCGYDNPYDVPTR